MVKDQRPSELPICDLPMCDGLVCLQQEAGQKGGALSQMVAAGNMFRNQPNQSEEIKEIQIENEQLKAMIEIMKGEME